MIYILTGTAKAGKTLLSNEFRKRTSISTFSTDYIMMMLHRGNNDLNVDIEASDSSVASKIEPYLHGLIETMIENNETYLIEGVHFNTDFSVKLQKEFKNKIKIIYIGYKDIALNDKITEIRKYKDVMNNPWLFNHSSGSMEEIIEYMIKESKRIHQECTNKGLKYIEITDINKQKDEIINYLLN